MRLQTIYLSAENLEESVGFWQDVLQRSPADVEDGCAHFSLDGVGLGLYDAAAHDGTIAYGDNCVPSFQTEDLEAEHTRIRGVSSFTEEITKEEDYSYFHFEDPAGNLIEVYEER